jgi:hypothetical protein
MGEKAWDALIRSRALVVDEMVSRQRTMRMADPVILRLTDRFTAACTRLAEIILKWPGRAPDALDAYRNALDAASLEKEHSEEALARACLPFRQEMDRSRIGFPEVKTALPTGSALLAFAAYDDTFAVKVESEADESSETQDAAHQSWHDGLPSYLAFVLRSDGSVPELVPLGQASEIDALVRNWQAAAVPDALVKSRPDEEDEAAYRKAGEALRRKIWDPVAPLFANSRVVYVVPDGRLRVVNFDSLPDDAGGNLVESSPTIQVLSSERDVVHAQE